MKKCLILLSLLSFLLLFLCSCRHTGRDGKSGDISGNAGTRYESSEGEFSAESGVSSADTPEKIDFLKTASRLLRADGEIAALIIEGGIYQSEPELEKSVSPRPLSAGNPYGDFAALRGLVHSVYTGDAGEYVLSFPPYGTPTVKNIDGKTWFSTHFAPEAAVLNPDFAPQIVEYGSERAVVAVETDLGFRLLVPFSAASGDWRMDACLYQLAEEYKNQDPGFSKPYRAPAMTAGSAPELTGKALLVNIFISDLVSEWDEKAVLSVLEREQAARLFLEDTARLYDSSLSMEITGEKTSLYLETTEKIPADIQDFVWIDLLFAQTVYTSLEGYVDAHFDTSRYDSWCAVLCLNKKGRSFAVPCDKTYSDWERYVAERAVIYHTEDEDYAYFDSPGVYVHELFHLYGARDLYLPYVDRSDDALLENYFPNDIMRVIPPDIGLAAVSPYTAFCIGWLRYPGEQFLFLTS